MKHPSISKLIVPLRNFKQKMMKEETFDYSKVPHNFGLCATDTCPYTDTCLRRIAYTYAPSNNIFLYVLNPKAIGVSKDIIRSGKGKLCSHQPSSNKSLQLPVTLGTLLTNRATSREPVTSTTLM